MLIYSVFHLILKLWCVCVHFWKIMTGNSNNKKIHPSSKIKIKTITSEIENPVCPFWEGTSTARCRCSSFFHAEVSLALSGKDTLKAAGCDSGGWPRPQIQSPCGVPIADSRLHPQAACPKPALALRESIPSLLCRAALNPQAIHSPQNIPQASVVPL